MEGLLTAGWLALNQSMEVRILPLQLFSFVLDAPIHTVQTTPGAPQGEGRRADGASAETFAAGRRKESACTDRVEAWVGWSA